MRYEHEDNQMWGDLLNESTTDLSRDEFKTKFEGRIKEYLRRFDPGEEVPVDHPWVEEVIVPIFHSVFSNPRKTIEMANKADTTLMGISPPKDVGDAFALVYSMEGPDIYEIWKKEDERKDLEGFQEKIMSEYKKFMNVWMNEYNDAVRSQLYGSEAPGHSDLGVPAVVEEDEKDPRGVHDRPAGDDEPPIRSDLNNEMIDKLLTLHDMFGEAKVKWSIHQGDHQGKSYSNVPKNEEGYLPGTGPGSAPIDSFEGLANFISLVSGDEEYASSVGLKDAVFEVGEHVHVFNNTPNQNISPVMTRFQINNMTRASKEKYNQQLEKARRFHKAGSTGDRFIGKFLKGEDQSPLPEELERHPAITNGVYTLAMYPKSKEISDRGDATYKAIGYGKPGRYHGD